MKNKKLSKKDKEQIAFAFTQVLDEPFNLSLSYTKKDGIDIEIHGNAGNCIIGCITFLFSLMDEHDIPRSRIKDMVDILNDCSKFGMRVEK